MASLLASTHKGTFFSLISTYIASRNPQQIPSGFLQSDAQCTNGCARHAASTLGSRFFILSCSAVHVGDETTRFTWVTKPRQCSSHFSCAIFKCDLLFKSPTFVTTAATKAWRRSSKELHEHSLHWQLLSWPLAHAQIHATSYDTMCVLPPSLSSLIQASRDVTQTMGQERVGMQIMGSNQSQPQRSSLNSAPQRFGSCPLEYDLGVLTPAESTTS